MRAQDRGIGRDLALYYEAYATFLELKGAYPRADLVYGEGVARGARPLERLKAKQAAFQQRMVGAAGLGGHWRSCGAELRRGLAPGHALARLGVGAQEAGKDRCSLSWPHDSTRRPSGCSDRRRSRR